MARPVNKKLTFFLVFISVIVLFRGQGQEYSFRHLTTKQGLPSNTINSIIKDSYGFMWFGTGNGLARYDGYDIRAIMIPEDTAFPSASQAVSVVFEDKKGSLWIGTLERGLWHYDQANESFIGFKHDPGNPQSLSHNQVNAVYKDHHGVLWIGTNGGLNKYDPENKHFITYKPDPSAADGPENQVYAIFEDKMGTLWIGTSDGVFEFDSRYMNFIYFNLGRNEPGAEYRRVTSIVQDNLSNLWFGTYWGMVKYDAVTHRTQHYLPFGLTPSSTGEAPIKTHISNIFIESVISSVSDSKTVLWIAAKWGLNRFDPESAIIENILVNENDPNSISSTHLKELYLDDTGLLWIGTVSSGVDILNTRPDAFVQVPMKFPQDNNNTYPACFCMDHEDTLWIGAYDGGLFKYDKDFNLAGNYAEWTLGKNAFDERQHNQINCIYEDSGHLLWLGYLHWGLVIFDRGQKKFRQIELPGNNGASPPDIVKSILQDHSGILWIGTIQGLYTIRRDGNLILPATAVKHNDLSRDDIYCIYEDSRFNLWISTRFNGLFCFPSGNRDSMIFEQYFGNRGDRKSFPGNFVTEIREDRSGALWLGTDLGLCQFNSHNNEFEPDTFFNASYPGCIINLYADDRNNLWILNSTKGFIKYQPGEGTTARVKVYENSDGLPFDNFQTRHYEENTFYQARDGRLFLGSIIGSGDGFLWFHPDSIRENNHVPNIIMSGFTVGNRAFNLDSNISFKKHIMLNHTQNFFTFGFSALDYIAPEQNQYAYYLEGYDKDWNYTGNRRFANYTGVPPGEYNFRVKGSNNDGYWNEKGTTIRISVTPPFWKTWWAYCIYAIVFITVLFSIIYFYLKRQRLLQNLALEKLGSEKLKEIDSLKTRFFTNISHEFRTPLTLILGHLQQLLPKTVNPDERQALAVVRQNALRLKELVNQLLDLSKLESGKMKLQCSETCINDFAGNIVESFESLAKHKNINLEFLNPEDKFLLYIDEKKLSQVLINLLSNAFKFTAEGGRITVEIFGPQSSASNYATISVTDTGRGIPPENLSRIFDRFYQVDDSLSREQDGSGIGLAIVRELVELHHGKVEVDSREGEGTTFRIYLPAGKEHLKKEEIIESRQSVVGSQQSAEGSWHFSSNSEVPHPKTLAQKGAAVILIVEDNPAMRSFIRGFFESTFQVIESGNGISGFELAALQVPDIIISDVMMPVMNGVEMTRRLKSDERTSHIPVILLTALASKEGRIEGLETGADDFVTKPFDGEELQVRVKNLIDQRKKLTAHYRREITVHAGEKETEVISMDEKFLKKARSVVEMNLSDPEYGVERFASDMALSRFQLHRKLTALVDQSTTEFIRTIRLSYAAVLLVRRAGTISEIAYDSGFNSPTYFTISFKKKYGISPSEYMERLVRK